MTNQTRTVDPATGEILDGQTFEVKSPTDEERIDVLAKAKEQLKSLETFVGICEMELMRLGEDRGATVIRGKGQNYVITTKKEYDRSKLPPVLELFDPEGKAKCFAEAHMEEVLVSEKWDMQQVNKYAKQAGNEALEIVEAATFPGKATGKLVDA